MVGRRLGKTRLAVTRDAEFERIVQRIRQSRETLDALDRTARERSPENMPRSTNFTPATWANGATRRRRRVLSNAPSVRGGAPIGHRHVTRRVRASFGFTGTQTPSRLPRRRGCDGPDRQGRRAGQVALMPRDARAKQNAQFFRDASEGISSLNAGRLSLEAMPFVCECAQFGCGAPVYLTLDEFRSVRSTPGHFVTIPGHVDAERERLVVSTGRYAVVTEIEAGEHSVD
jgi:hypothetical protein